MFPICIVRNIMSDMDVTESTTGTARDDRATTPLSCFWTRFQTFNVCMTQIKLILSFF